MLPRARLARADARVTLTDKLAYDGQPPELLDVLPNRRASWAAPFSLSVDPVRALLQGFQAFVGFVLMLAVMSLSPVRAALHSERTTDQGLSHPSLSLQLLVRSPCPSLLECIADS